MADEQQTTQDTTAQSTDAFGQPRVEVVRAEKRGGDPKRIHGRDAATAMQAKADGYEFEWVGGPSQQDVEAAKEAASRRGAQPLPSNHDVRIGSLPRGGPEQGEVWYQTPEQARANRIARTQNAIACRRRIDAANKPELVEAARSIAGLRHGETLEITTSTTTETTRESTRQGARQERPRARGKAFVQVGADLT